jgi:Mg2+/Co2+ transporter CorB
MASLSRSNTKVVVSPDTLIVNFVDGAKSELTAGAKITTAQAANLLASAIAKQAAVLAYIDGFIAAAAGTFVCLLLTAILPANSRVRT